MRPHHGPHAGVLVALTTVSATAGPQRVHERASGAENDGAVPPHVRAAAADAVRPAALIGRDSHG